MMMLRRYSSLLPVRLLPVTYCYLESTGGTVRATTGGN